MNEEITVLSLREQIIQERVEKIKEAHSGLQGQAGTMVSALLAGANFRRAAGIHLEALKMATDANRNKIIRHGEWEKLFKSAKGKSCTNATFDFDHSTATRYMAFAKKHLEPITDINQIVTEAKPILQDAGQIELPEGRPQALHEFDFVGSVAKRVFDYKAFWGAQLKKEPIEQWPEERKEVVREQLQWFVDRYRELGGEA